MSPNDEKVKQEISEDEEDVFEDAENYEDVDEFKGSLKSLGISDAPADYLAKDLALEMIDDSLKQVKVALDYFLNSEYDIAEIKLKKGFKKTLYFTHGYAVLLTMKSLMTFDPNDIANALLLLNEAVEISNCYRKKEQSIMGSIQGYIKGIALDKMDKLQRHAELVFAEAYLLKALISIINNESIMTAMKEVINIRASHSIYKQCLKWIEKKELEKEYHLIDSDFASGVFFGMGLFNMILSLLPSRAIAFLELVGFSASRKKGLSLLQSQFNQGGLREFMCNLTVVAYYTVMPTFISNIKHESELVDNHLNQGLSKYPNGAFYLYFKARTLQFRLDINESINYYHKSINSQHQWQQLHHICYWDLTMNHVILLEFDKAAICQEKLEEASKWSKATYKYLRAANLLMSRDLLDDKRISDTLIDDLMTQVPNSMQRIIGKRIPVEKFVSRKSRKYFLQGKRLHLPAFEIMMFWNLFNRMGETLPKALEILFESQKKLEEKVQTDDTYNEDLCLNTLLLAIAYRENKKNRDSEALFLKLFEMEKNIVLDQYISPFGRYEYARLLVNLDRTTEAKAMLEAARNNYRKYSMERSLQLRVHNLLLHIKENEI
jgi:tetratricopeptide (TPR) repeat protein